MSFENYFNHLQNMGSMLSDEQKDDLKKMGEKFYGSIDMEKYKPVPTEEFNQESFSEDFVLHVKYNQLQHALESGLLEEDLTEEEREILNKVKKD
jgi:hypothetical protein